MADIRVSICTPSSGIVHAAYAMGLPGMLLHYFQTPVMGQKETDNREALLQIQLGANIGANRDAMVDEAIKVEATHVLFIDDDMGFLPETLNVMLARQLPVLLCNYRRKIPPGLFTATNKDNTASIQTTPESTSCVEAYFGGFGFALIETQVFKALKKPRFLMYYTEELGYTTEDRPFFDAVHKAGFPVFVDQDASKMVWHNGTFNYCYDQVLPPEWDTPTPMRLLRNMKVNG